MNDRERVLILNADPLIGTFLGEKHMLETIESKKQAKAAYDKAYRKLHPDKQRKIGYYANHREQLRAYNKSWNHQKGICKPMNESRKCALFLGVHVAERVLSKFFDNIIRMPFGNKGFDFWCGRGFMIDCKSSVLHSRSNCKQLFWKFGIHKNQTADYFLCLGFNNREDLTPLRVWLIPGDVVHDRDVLAISNNTRGVNKWQQYERPLDRVITCCSELEKEGKA